MGDFKYRLYCCLHLLVKKILRRSNLSVGNFFKSSSLKLGVSSQNAVQVWGKFINQSVISVGDFQGNLYAGYIAEEKKWCLASWIWTNASVVRSKCSTGHIKEAEILASLIMKRQLKCGGWIVRNDYDKKGAIPMLAPNDSAYIANNAFLTLYEKTGNSEYLDVACRCADWIIDTARADGMVYVGFNMRDQKWDKECIIVDVGFTGGLFAHLYELTHEIKYYNFLIKFVRRYIELFYMPKKCGFCTSVGKNDLQQGGMFGRGQAWALEGLIPAYRVSKDKYIKQVICDTVNNLVKTQLDNGAWVYNLTKPLMGIDCKAVSVLAKNLLDWYMITKDENIRKSAVKALNWCCDHTSIEGDSTGGIFSFCMEGAIVHSLYTSCAFVYSSAYAIELYNLLKDENNNNDF